MRNFDTEFDISFVGIMNILLYTQSEHSRIAEKYLTRLVKNGMAVVHIATVVHGPPSFW